MTAASVGQRQLSRSSSIGNRYQITPAMLSGRACDQPRTSPAICAASALIVRTVAFAGQLRDGPSAFSPRNFPLASNATM